MFPQACTDDSSAHEVQERPNIQGVIFNETWCNGVDFGAIVQEGHASLSIDSYPGYILNPIPSIKGIGIQEEESVFDVLSLGCPILGTFGGVTFV